jgi:hypothetical protein
MQDIRPQRETLVEHVGWHSHLTADENSDGINVPGPSETMVGADMQASPTHVVEAVLNYHVKVASLIHIE